MAFEDFQWAPSFQPQSNGENSQYLVDKIKVKKYALGQYFVVIVHNASISLFLITVILIYLGILFCYYMFSNASHALQN